MARALVAMVSELDVRAALRLIQAPTLVLHTTGDRFIPVAHSGYLHAHIDGSRLIEIPGEDHHPTGTSGEHLVEEIVEFLTGNRPAPRCERVLATVVFTDIIGSTARAAELGDQRWRHLLDSHDAVVRAELSRSRRRDQSNRRRHAGHLRRTRPRHRLRLRDPRVSHSPWDEVRGGVHTGEIELRGEDIGGIAVHLGARIAALGGPSEILVSRTVTDLVAGSGTQFEDRGRHELKGVPGTWQLYAVSRASGRDGPSVA